MNLLVLGNVLVYTAMLLHLTASGQICSTSGFLDPLNVDSYDPTRLVPLLGRYETSGREQWIFFDLQFTCRGRLTKWIFRGLPEQDIGVELTTWRLNTQSNFFTSYDRVSTTERNAGRPSRNGAVFTYELISPVEFLPGDIVGVEMGFISFGGTSNNVIALNISGSGSTSMSYRKSGGGPSFILQSTLNIRERDIIPLLQAVIEPLQESTTAMNFPTDSPQAVTTAMGLSTDLPTTAMDLSTDLLTTAMDLSTDLPTKAMDLSTDLPTTVLDLSTDLVQTISTGTMPTTKMEVRPELDEMDQQRGKPMVTIVAGVVGGITGILIIAILSVCIACITKHIQVHVHYDGAKNSDSRHQENTSNSSGTLVQMNTAYRQAVPNDIATATLSNKHLMQHNLAYGSQNQMPEGTESGSTGDYERMSNYVAFHHGNPTHREEGTCSHLALPMVYVMPVQQGQSNTYAGEYDDEHSYEYIQ